MLDLDPCQRGYAAAMLAVMPYPSNIFAALRLWLGDAPTERRHDAYAQLVRRTAAGDPLTDQDRYILCSLSTDELTHARAAQAWLDAAVEAVALAHRLAPPKVPPWMW